MSIANGDKCTTQQNTNREKEQPRFNEEPIDNITLPDISPTDNNITVGVLVLDNVYPATANTEERNAQRQCITPPSIRN